MGWRRWCISSGRLQRLQGNTSDIFSDPAELNSLKKSSKDLNLCNFCWLRWFSLNRVTNHLLRRGRTPLWHASWNGSTSVMQMLLDAGAGVDAKSNGRLDEKIEKRMGLGQRGGISWFFMIFHDENPFDMMLQTKMTQMKMMCWTWIFTRKPGVVSKLAAHRLIDSYRQIKTSRHPLFLSPRFLTLDNGRNFLCDFCGSNNKEVFAAQEQPLNNT